MVSSPTWTGSTRVHPPDHQLLTQKRCRAMFYDESIYPMPYTYDPERYLKNGQLDPSVKDPEERVFGSGRRYESRAVVPSPPVIQLTQPHKNFPYRSL